MSSPFCSPLRDCPTQLSKACGPREGFCSRLSLWPHVNRAPSLRDRVLLAVPSGSGPIKVSLDSTLSDEDIALSPREFNACLPPNHYWLTLLRVPRALATPRLIGDSVCATSFNRCPPRIANIATVSYSSKVRRQRFQPLISKSRYSFARNAVVSTPVS